ncbi:MAG: class I SAM-dependent RNA methyltransferase [Flavobacteriales bacterium]|nr:class I SAM-dependent RNA methyltransferase [Flavobacteriales bacterium]MDW8431822.1 class I SAM-dependent RNA methyltransferase [Flavobacteriales bacterium]
MVTDNLSDILVLKTFAGLEDVLMKECEEAGLGPAEKGVRAVYIPHRKDSVIRANMALRTALRVLVPLGQFHIQTADDIYEGARQVRWSLFMKTESRFRVQSSVHSSLLKHTGYAVLRLKDAICDQVREVRGFRPTVDKVAPDWIVDLHIHENVVHLSLDTSGPPLFKRGWRRRNGEAPLNEVLAAALIRLAGWKDEEEDFFDLMCGSGTLVIEAADIASGKAPGLHGRPYSFMGYPGFDIRFHQKVKRDLASHRKEIKVKIWGSDADKEALAAARINAASAGHSDTIFLKKTDFRKLDFQPTGLLLLNPPYNKRIETPGIARLYQELGRFLKHQCHGARAGIFSGYSEALKRLGLKPSKTHKLFNGDIPCTLALFELFEGRRNEYLKLQHEQRLV